MVNYSFYSLFKSFICLGVSLNVKDTSLRVGDKAPNLQNLIWIKGKPIEKLAKGNIYIVEFGTVGCTPCRASIPHLSKLQMENPKKLTIISVFVWENKEFDSISTGYVNRVNRFVKKMGDQIKYRVAVDNPQRSVDFNWMRAAKQDGVPVAFVVDRDGIIAWIGYPLDLDSVINEITENTFDRKGGEIKEIEKQSEYSSLLDSNHDIYSRLKLVNRLIQQNPADQMLYFFKFRIELGINEDSAYEFARNLLNSENEHLEPALYYIGRSIVEEKHDLNHPDLDLAIKLGDRATLLCKDDVLSAFIIFQVQAKAYAYKGDFANAIILLEKALSILDSYGRDEIPNETNTSRADMNRDLELYKQGKTR
jgi:thiol-disulfide isomerase/thioredoxin